MRRIVLLTSFCSALLLSGCSKSERTRATGSWPEYKLADPPQFTEEERAAVTEFATKNPTLYAKIKGYSDGNKAILLAHNKKARQVNRQRLKDLGATEEELKQWLGAEPKEPDAGKE